MTLHILYREKSNIRLMYRVEGRHLEILEHLLKGYSMVSNSLLILSPS